MIKLNVPWLVLEEATSNLILSNVPLDRVPSELWVPELFIIVPSDRVSKVKVVSLTISLASKVIVAFVPTAAPPRKPKDLEGIVIISPTEYPEPPLVAVIVETAVPDVKVILAVKAVPVPPDPEIVYVPAEPVTPAKEVSKASAFVDISPLSSIA